MLNKILAVAALATSGLVLGKLFMKTRGSETNSSVEVSIDVEVPVRAAYQQWARFEDFPKFMSGVHEVQQLDEKHLRWRADVAGKEKKWNAEIVEQIPYMRIAWRSTSWMRDAGVVTFRKISETATKIVLKTDCDPRRFSEQVYGAMDAVRMQAMGTLNNFKDLLERSGKETVT